MSDILFKIFAVIFAILTVSVTIGLIIAIIWKFWKASKSTIGFILKIIAIPVICIFVVLIIYFAVNVSERIKTMLTPIYYTIKPTIEVIYDWVIYLCLAYFLILIFGVFIQSIQDIIKRKKMKKEEASKNSNIKNKKE